MRAPSRAAAQRELLQIAGSVKPWEAFTAEQEERMAYLRPIAYPGGMPLPRLRGAGR